MFVSLVEGPRAKKEGCAQGGSPKGEEAGSSLWHRTRKGTVKGQGGAETHTGAHVEGTAGQREAAGEELEVNSQTNDGELDQQLGWEG